MTVTTMQPPLVIGPPPRPCTECGHTWPALMFPIIDGYGTYGDVCVRCDRSGSQDRPPVGSQRAAWVPWAGGGWAQVELTWSEVNRIILLAALEGCNYDEIQERLREANEAMKTGREIVL